MVKITADQKKLHKIAAKVIPWIEGERKLFEYIGNELTYYNVCQGVMALENKSFCYVFFLQRGALACMYATTKDTVAFFKHSQNVTGGWSNGQFAMYQQAAKGEKNELVSLRLEALKNVIGEGLTQAEIDFAMKNWEVVKACHEWQGGSYIESLRYAMQAKRDPFPRPFLKVVKMAHNLIDQK